MDIGTLLFNHDPNQPIGRILSAEIDTAGRRGVAKVRFDEDEASETIYRKVTGGSLKGVSIGYRIDARESVREGAMSANGRFQGPVEIATKWTAYEISIVSVPADASVGVGRSETYPETVAILESIAAAIGAGRSENPEESGEIGGFEMAEENKKQDTGELRAEEMAAAPRLDGEARQAAVAEAQQRAVKEERARVGEISAMCRSFDLSPDAYITDGRTVDEARAAVLEQLAAKRRPVQVTVVADEGEKFRAAAADGLALRAGIDMEKPAAGAENFRGKSLLRIAAECLERDGMSGVNGMQDEELVRAAMTGAGAFPGILSNVAHKSMARSYQTAPTTFQLWTARGANTDFKEATRYRLSEADELVKMTESGEFQHAEVTEGAAKTAVATYGRSFSITRKAIINDDMGAISRIPALYGAAARRGINKLVYEILTKNPTIEGAALFHNNHGNLASGAISVASLGAAKAKMARQKNIGGRETLNVQPAFLIVPPELEVTAAQLISSVVDPTKANATPNPFANRLTVVSDPELADTDAWYLAAAPGILPCVEVTYLNGREQPTMESAVQFDTLGIKWRIYLDFGVNLIDYRGLLKSTGK